MMEFLKRSRAQNGEGGKYKINNQRGKKHSKQPKRRPGCAPLSRRRLHPCAKKVEISFDGIPPSTIIEMRFSNWSRTASAVVHSDSPLRLAEVAVIGICAASTTASGMAALGTRSATCPVFAVTLSGKRDEAFTITVSGPGQY